MNGVVAEICQDCGGVGSLADCDDCCGTGQCKCDCGHSHACSSCRGKRTEVCESCFGTGNGATLTAIQVHAWNGICQEQREYLHANLQYMRPGYPVCERDKILVRGKFPAATRDMFKSLGIIPEHHGAVECFVLDLSTPFSDKDFEALRSEVGALISPPFRKEEKKTASKSRHLRAVE